MHSFRDVKARAGSEKGYAVAAVSALMEGGVMNQKDLAIRLGVGETVLANKCIRVHLQIMLYCTAS